LLSFMSSGSTSTTNSGLSWLILITAGVAGMHWLAPATPGSRPGSSPSL
jgi:hypothetical protein